MCRGSDFAQMPLFLHLAGSLKSIYWFTVCPKMHVIKCMANFVKCICHKVSLLSINCALYVYNMELTLVGINYCLVWNRVIIIAENQEGIIIVYPQTN